jgi:4'-phosphopantetheinyl transferase
VITALDVDEVHVWHRLTETASPDTSIDDHVLSADERARRDRFHSSNDRRDYARAHDLLRRSLSRYADVPPHAWRFVEGLYGKPTLGDAVLSFNLSHTRGLAACGIARSIPLGLDVERIDRSADVRRLAACFFTTAETAALVTRRIDRCARFLDLWTLKEAFIKAIGTGLSQPLDSFSFDLDRDERHIGFAAPPGYDASEWQFALYVPAPDARLAVAVHAPGSRPLRWQAHELRDRDSTRLEPLRMSRG